MSKVFPDLLLATMDIIHTQYKNLKGRDGYTFNTDETKERVRGCSYHFKHFQILKMTPILLLAFECAARTSQSDHKYGSHSSIQNAR